MSRVYLRAGLYAEGPSDYAFLCRLLNRHIEDLAATLFPGNYEVADTDGIDAPRVKTSRADRIAKAIEEAAESYEFFVIHSDGESDTERVYAERVKPGMDAARAACPDRQIITVACMPVREIEAWLLADPRPFRELCGTSFQPELPAAPEKEADPKATWERLIKEGGAQGRPYALFGENVGLEKLRALPAFRVFEGEMIDAIKQVARVQGQQL